MSAERARRRSVVRLRFDPSATDDLPRLDDDARVQLTEHVCRAIGEVNGVNAERETWWYTSFSARDRLTSELIGWMHWLERLRRHVDAKPSDVTVAVRDPVLFDAALRLARQQGWRTIAGISDRRRAWVARRRRDLRLLSSRPWFLATAAGLLLVSRRVRRPGGKATDVDVIIVSIFGSAPGPGEEWRDPYFGPLPRWLAERGERVLIAGHLRGTSRLMLRSILGTTPPVVALARFASAADWWHAVAACRRPRPALPVGTTLDRVLVRAALSAEPPAIALGVLLRRSLDRLLRRNPGARVIQLFEGNPWERAVMHAARRAEPARHVTGYLHCAVVPAHLKLRMSAADVAVSPLPDRIVCTGPEARAALLAVGAYPPTLVESGCALRATGLGGVPRDEPPDRLTTVLVLLEGITTMVDLLRVVAAAAAELPPDVRVVLRPHPTLPLDHLSPLAGVAVGGSARLQPSTSRALVDDLEAADAVVYQGTTAALSAGWYGIPLVHVDAGDVLDDDPLFLCRHLSRTVRTAAELAEALLSSSMHDPVEFRIEAAALREYVDGYLAQPDDDRLRAFTEHR